MKEILKYRDNFYFNNKDFFLYVNNLNQIYITKLELYNGNWYPIKYGGFIGGKLYPSGHWRAINKNINKGCLQINLKTVKSINCNELYGLIVEIKNTNIKGEIVNYILNNLGIVWDNNQGKNYKQFGFPYFWNDPNKIKLL